MTRQDKKMLEKYNKYKIKINAGGQALTYTCEVLEIDSHFIRVKDKFGYIQNITLSSIVSFEELNSGGYKNE